MSSQAEVCPHCNHPHEKEQKKMTGLIQALLLAATILLLLTLQNYGVIDIVQIIKSILGK